MFRPAVSCVKREKAQRGGAFDDALGALPVDQGVHARSRSSQARRMRAAFRRGPCAAVRWGRQARRGIDRDVDSFSSGQARTWMSEVEQRRSSCRSPVEKPGPSSRTCRAWMSGKRQAGWPSLWVIFLLLRASCPPPFGPASLFVRAPSADVATQEKSDSVAIGAR